MKLKFEKEVQDVIDAIAALPEMTTNEIAMKAPSNIIAQFNKTLIARKNDKAFAQKLWAKQRRQLSFMYEFFRLSTIKGVMERFAMEQHTLAVKENPDTPAPDTEAETVTEEVAYYAVVKFFKDIKSGKLLQKPEFIRLAMSYGVIYLSDQELQSLADNNKV